MEGSLVTDVDSFAWIAITGSSDRGDRGRNVIPTGTIRGGLAG